MFAYNMPRKILVLSEYGRNIDKIVQYITELPDREKRTQYAHYVIDIMGHLNPHLRDVGDFKHKLWDHLFIISEGKLDVDFPYGKPTKKDLKFFPERLDYPKNRVPYRYYGNTICLMIDKASNMPDSEERDNFVSAIAQHLKALYVQWNKENITDEAILEDLKALSKGKIDVRNIKLQALNGDVKPKQIKVSNKPVGASAITAKNTAKRHAAKSKRKNKYNK